MAIREDECEGVIKRRYFFEVEQLEMQPLKSKLLQLAKCYFRN